MMLGVLSRNNRPKSNNRLGQNKISYERYLGKDTRNNRILFHHNLQILDLKIEIFPYWETQARRSLIVWLRKSNYLLHSFLNYWLMLYIESSDIPKFFCDIKKMPKEDQKDWEKACDDEMKSLADRKVWKLVDLPPGCKAIKCQWVFVAKSDGRKKACLVAKGFTQVYGIDFEETFSPVARFETIRILLALAALEDWDIESLNVKTTYLYGELDEEIYMDQPEGYIKKGQERKVCRLLKSLYGLEQSALQWNKELHKSLLDLGFTRT